MKKIILFICNFVLPVLIYSTNSIYMGDKFYNEKNKLINGKPDISVINKAINYYKQALKEEPDKEIVLYKLTKAINFKFNYLPTEISESEKEKEYEWLLNKIKRVYNKKSKYLNYSLALLWGRYGELIGIMTAAKKGIAGKIKEAAERLYKIDKKFEEHFASLILGRLHYKTPKIPFILTWPDLDKSKKYLYEVIKFHPDNYWAKFYLADTLYELDEVEKAKQYYKQILDMKIPPQKYFEYLSLKKECKLRVQELGLLLK